MSRTASHTMHRYCGHKEFEAELAARKAHVERIETNEEVIDHEQRRLEFAEANMLHWAGHDEGKAARFAVLRGVV